MRSPTFIGLLVMLGSTNLWMACGSPPEPPEVVNPEPATYSVRGVIRQVRPALDGKTQLSILHEAIPDFVGITGEVVGMKSMTMPFTVADDVDLTGFEPGSRVQIQLSVDWDRAEPGLITAIETLPEDVLLSFESLD